MKYRAEVNLSDKNGKNPILISSSKGFIEISRLLIANGANPYLCDKYGKNAIERAKDLNLITLLQKGYNKKRKSKKSKSLTSFTHIFSRINGEEWKKTALGKRIEGKVSEKINEMKNRLTIKNENILNGVISEKICREREKLSESCKKWALAYRIDMNQGIEEHLKRVLTTEPLKFDMAALFDAKYEEKLMDKKNKTTYDLKMHISKPTKLLIQDSIQVSKQYLFHSISKQINNIKEEINSKISLDIKILANNWLIYYSF